MNQPLSSLLRKTTAVLVLVGATLARAITMDMTGDAVITAYSNTPWTLQKAGSFAPGSNPAIGSMNWTVTVGKGATTSYVAVQGYFDLTNGTPTAIPITSVIVSLRDLDGNYLSSNVADSTVGDAATQAAVDINITGVTPLVENAGSGTLTFRNGSNSPITLNSPTVSIPAGQTIRIYYTATFNNTVLNIAPGTTLIPEAVVNFGNSFDIPTLSVLSVLDMPAPIAANASVTLLDTTLTTSGTVTVGSFAGLNQLLTQATAQNVTVTANGGAQGGTVCNTATLTSPNTTVATINNIPLIIPGISLTAQDCDDIPHLPGPQPISATISSCSQTVTYDASLFTTPNGPIVSATFNPPSGTVFPFGTTPVSFSVTDVAGITSTGTLYVTVLDTEAPVITPISNITVPIEPGKCTAKVTYSTTAQDCNLDTITYSPASGSDFPVGTSTVTITAKDLANHTSTSTFTVTVLDTEAPVITPHNVQVATSGTNCTPSATFNVTANDCTAVTLIYSLNSNFSTTINSGAPFPVGTTTVYVKATDTSGNSSTSSFTVTVVDTEAPVINAGNIQTSTSGTNCTPTVNFNATYTDCSAVTLVYSLNATFTPALGNSAQFPVGTTTVYVKATDASGNSSSTTFTVTVTDTEAPVITANNMNATTSGTNCTPTVTFNATYTDCSTATLVYSLNPSFTPALGNSAQFPIGVTTVYVKATDTSGNSSSTTFTVTVTDTEAPVLTTPNMSANTTAESCTPTVVFNASATDCSTVTLVYSLNASFTPALGNSAQFPVGVTTVYVKATDAAGNSSSGSFTVTVTDTTAPVLTTANISASVTGTNCNAAITFNATATDCSPYTIVYSLNSAFSPTIASGSNFPIGTTTVYVKATDSAGNATTKTFTVTVSDTTAPVITAPNMTANAGANCNAVVTFGASATDCSNVTLVYSLSANFSSLLGSSASFPIGVTTVYVKATDASNNSSTSSFTVTVADVTAPVITAPNMTANAVNGSCAAPITFNATAADCSGPVTIIYSLNSNFTSPIASGSSFPVGTTTVYVKATDTAGNFSTSSFTVTVADTQAPVITSPLNNLTLQVDSGQCYATFNYTPAATDNCSGSVTMSVSPASGTHFAAGTTTTVTVTATDSAGNVTTRTFTVTVGTCTQPCVAGTVTFTGSSSGTGTAGNIRTFTVNGINVKASAFSRTKGTSGSWATAYLGLFSGGLGVTDGSEDGNNNTHTVDNVGRDNFVLFEFSQPVTINRAYLGYVVTDSDLTAWVGNVTNAYTNHVTLSDSILSGLLKETDTTDSSSTRWATLNEGAVSGNVLVIAADVDDATPDDYFKVAALELCQPSTPLTLACVTGTTGTVGTAYSSSLVANGGRAPYTFSITAGALPAGLTLNPTTGAITGTPTTAGSFSFTAKVVDATAGTAQTQSVNCNITIAPPPVCTPTTFSFSGNTSTTGTAGNIRTYTVNGISVKVSAFSRTTGTTGTWAAAYLGAYSGGLGVTDTSEDGSTPNHAVDNVGRYNFVLFEFSQPVTINRAYLGWVSGDSDLSAWVGTISNAYNNHVSLTDASFTNLTYELNETDSSSTRWARLNAGAVSGNVLVIAASLEDTTPDDYFKIGALDICQPTNTPPVLGCPAVVTGTVGTAYSQSLRAEGGTPAYTYSIISGALPGGLTLNPTTGVISGTPTTGGSFSFTAKVVDSKGLSDTQSCCITISQPATATGKIGNFVWKDNDGDGIQDSTEPGIPGVTVQLKNSSGVVIATDVTDSSGIYGFEGLTAGTYTVVVIAPSGYTPSPTLVGSNRAVDSNTNPTTVTLATNSSSDLTIDFGFVPQTTCPKPLTTYTQGGWGATPNGNNPGAVLAANFNTVYPGGYVQIGSGSKILKFTSASAITNFLPQGGTAGALSSGATNPTTSSAGVLAGQLLAARLSVDFSNAGLTGAGLGNKKVGSGALKGKTVLEVIAIANSVISGGAMPSGLTFSKINDALTMINENYDGGSNQGDLY